MISFPLREMTVANMENGWGGKADFRKGLWNREGMRATQMYPHFAKSLFCFSMKTINSGSHVN